MNHPFPLFIKLAAAAATGTAALLSLRRHRRFAALHSLRRDILHALRYLHGGANAAAAPPAILVLGFKGHGKSAFVNTACRALAGEEGPMVLRSETVPVGLPQPTAARLVVRAAAAAGCYCGGWVEEMAEEEAVGKEGAAVELVDVAPLPELAVVTAAQLEAALDAAATVSGDGGAVAAPPPESVVVVLRYSRLARERHLGLRRVAEIAGIIRKRGLHLLVVLTYNKRSLRNCTQEQLKVEVAFKAGIDCVYFIENYTAKCSTKCRAVTAIKNNFDTDYTALTIIRQCIEFSTQHRRQSSRKMINLAGQVSETNKEENVENVIC